MLAEHRRREILELIIEEGSARVRDLSQTFSVSEPTIRQDLERLEADGLIVREHGGAYLKGVPNQVQSMSFQHIENMDRKQAIGRKAAEYVSDGETLILDSGSTTTEVARNLLSRNHLNVVTNALNIALIVGANPSCSVLVTGGLFKPPTLSLSGERAAAFFDGLHAQRLFLATGGISYTAGLTYPGLSDLPVKRAMIQCAQTVYLVADSTKIGRAAFASMGALDSVHVLITDDGIRDEDRSVFESMGIEVVIAGVAGAKAGG